MRYGQIRKYDIANGPGIRTSIFVTGCTHRCPECFNQEYQDFSFGQEWTSNETNLILRYLAEEQVEGLSLLGGEPFQNTEGLIKLLQEVRKYSNKSVWIYSGYTYEELIKNKENAQLLSLCNILVDGPFVNELKDLRLRFRGSSNQRIIDLDQTRQINEIVIWK